MTHVNKMYITVNVNQSLTDTYVGDMSASGRYLKNPKNAGTFSSKSIRLLVLCEQHLFDKLTFVVVSYSDPRMAISLFSK